MMAVVHTIHLSSNVGVYVLALIYGIYGAAVRNRDGATTVSLIFMILAMVTAILGQFVP